MEKPVTTIERRALDSPTPLFGDLSSNGYNALFEVSLNQPRTAKYLRLLSKQQKKSYKFIFTRMRESIPGPVKTYSQTYEYSNDGNIHTHAWVALKGNYAINGVIADMVKIYKQYVRKGIFKPNHYYPEYNRYKDESCCIQYVDLSTPDGILEAERWNTYINKYQRFEN